jgi:hypothetical protein
VAFDLVSAQDIKQWLKKLGGEQTEPTDAALKDAVDRVSQYVREVTGREVKQESRVQIYHGTGRPSLHVSAYPVQSSPTPTVRTRAGDVWTDWSSIVFGAIDPHQTGEIMLAYGVWPRGRFNIEITYTGGYASTSAVPDDLQLAVIIGIDIVLRYRTDGVHILTAVQNDRGGAKTYKADQSNLIFFADTIANHRRFW